MHANMNTGIGHIECQCWEPANARSIKHTMSAKKHIEDVNRSGNIVCATKQPKGHQCSQLHVCQHTYTQSSNAAHDHSSHVRSHVKDAQCDATCLNTIQLEYSSATNVASLHPRSLRQRLAKACKLHSSDQPQTAPVRTGLQLAHKVH